MPTEMQVGSRPGKRCQSAVFKKVMSHDHIRMLHTTAAFVKNDAVGCYDHLMNNLILMVLQKLGLSPTTTKALGTLWDSTIHLMVHQLLPMALLQICHYMVQGRVVFVVPSFDYYAIGS